MSESFDPYYKWLAINPEEQPPNHYRLLGLTKFEGDADAIHAAADQRMAHLKTYQSGPHSAISQTLLNEVAAAKICLLSPAKKAAYDAELRAKLQAEQAANAPPVADDITQSALNHLIGEPTERTPERPTPHHLRRQKGIDPRILAAVAIVMALACVALIFAVQSGGKLTPEVSPLQVAKSPTSAGTGVPTAEPREKPKSSHGEAAEGITISRTKPVGQATAVAEPPHTSDASGAATSQVAQPMLPADQPNARLNSGPERDLHPEIILPLASESQPTTSRLEESLQTIEVTLVKAKNPAEYRSVAEAAIKLANEAIDAGRHEISRKSATIVLSAARKMQCGALAKLAVLCLLKNHKIATGALVLDSDNPWLARLPIPTATEQERAGQLVQEAYASDHHRALDESAKRGLARQLLDKARTLASDSAGQFALLNMAQSISAESTDGSTLFQILDEKARVFEIDDLAEKAEMLVKMSKVATSPKQRGWILDKTVSLIQESVSRDRYETTDQLGQLGRAIAQRDKNRTRARQLADILKAVKEAAAQHELAAEALRSVEEHPADAEANLIAGRYLCFIKADWDRGLPMLALGDDEQLKALAAAELEGASATAEQVKIADGWWDIAKKQEGIARGCLQDRAVYWYQMSVGELTGLQRAKVEKRLKDLQEPSIDSAIPVNRWVNLLTHASPPQGVVAGDWERRGLAVACATQTAWARWMLPARVHGEYDLAMTFTRDMGNDMVCIIVPVGSHYCDIEFSGWRGWSHSLEMIDGRDGRGNSTTVRPGTLTNGHKYRVLVKVRFRGEKAMIDVSLDDKSLIHWEGKEESLSTYGWTLPQPQRIGIGAFGNVITLHSAQLRMVSGMASWADQGIQNRGETTISNDSLVPARSRSRPAPQRMRG